MVMFRWCSLISIAFESLSLFVFIKFYLRLVLCSFVNIWDSLSGRWEVFSLVKSWNIVLYAKYHHFNFISSYLVKNVFLIFPVWFLGDWQFCNISTIQTENSDIKLKFLYKKLQNHWTKPQKTSAVVGLDDWWHDLFFAYLLFMFMLLMLVFNCLCSEKFCC